MTRVVVLAAMVAGLVGLALQPASAQYADSLSCGSNELTPGETVTVFGDGFAPGSTVTVSLGGVTFDVIADANGEFTLDLVVPALAPGDYVIEAQGTGVDSQPRSISCDVTVVSGVEQPTPTPTPLPAPAVPKSSSGPLAFTGSSMWLLPLGLVAIALGGVAVLAAQRRRGRYAA